MGFLTSPAPIYKTMKHEGTLRYWVDEDYHSMMTPMLNAGFEWDANTERMVLPTATTSRKMIFTTPWCHAKGTPRKHCGMDHQILFNAFHIIHPRCLSCWKVVVTPNTFKQTCQLEVLQKNMDVPSKCGIELRDYTPKHYGGYFYTHSLEEGRERYEQVRKGVDEALDDGKNISVILKRGCTEYEMIRGPSVFWCNTKDEERFIELVDAFVDVPRSNNRQSEVVKTNVRLKWALWAHANGDFTYQELNNGQPLFPDYVKFHEGDIEGLKQDLATGAAIGRGDLDMETGQKFLTEAGKFAVENNTTVNELGGLFRGSENVDVLASVPEEAKGDLDELT